ncbi:MAG: hypothetical protein H6Q58_1561 [Firmicutes bacterium]|nr:hypothetical protein [Bacillota bacterium]
MKKGDKIAAIVIALIVVISSIGVLVFMNMSGSSHHIAEIKQDGKVIRTIDLDQVESSEEIRIAYEDEYNIIRVEKGRIRIIDSDCPDKLCVKTGWITEPGQSVICLPHKLIIKIQGGSREIDENVY